MKKIVFLVLMAASSLAWAQVQNPTTSVSSSANVAGGAVGAQPYQTAASTTAFIYPATDANALNLDGNRTDTYTPDGTPERPYKTITQLLAGAAGVTGPYVIACNPTTAAYAYTGAVTFPAYQTTIIGNGCNWNITGNVTVPGVYFISNLGTTITGTLAYTSASTAEKVRIGGSLTVSGGITTSGYDHFFDMSILSNTVINVGAGSTPVFTNVVGTPLFRSASGSTAATVLTIIDSQSLATGAYTNVDMSNGGLAVIRGFVATNNGTLANINLSGSSGVSTTVASSLASVSSAWVASGASCTYIDNGSIYGLLTGTCLYTPSGLGMSAPATNTMTVKSGTTGAATFDSGTAGAVNVGTGANAKTITVGNQTGATAVAIKSGSGNITLNNATVPAAGRTASLLPAPSVTVYMTAGSGTYTTPTGAVMLHLRMVGGGGGGCGGGTSTPAATTGSDSTFGAFTAPGGYGCAGTTPTTSTSCNINSVGTAGSPQHSGSPSTTAEYLLGGTGGSSVFAGGGSGKNNTNPGDVGTIGGGGGGGGTTGVTGVLSGTGGSGAAYCESWITSPAASYSYVTGAGGVGGASGTSGGAGGAGGAGAIIVEAY